MNISEIHQCSLLGDHVWKYQTACNITWYLGTRCRMVWYIVADVSEEPPSSWWNPSKLKYQVSPFIPVLILERLISQSNTVMLFGKRLSCVETSAVPWPCQHDCRIRASIHI